MAYSFIVSFDNFKLKKIDLKLLDNCKNRRKNFQLGMFLLNQKFLGKKNFISINIFKIKKFSLFSGKISSESFFYEDLTNDGGVMKKIIKAGSGNNVTDKSIVKVHYEGKIESGIIFDSSYERKEPYIFTIGEGKVIKGWEIGIKSMKVGEKALFEILPYYGYKKKGIPPIIPPNAKLFYEVELLEISTKNQETDVSSINIQTSSYPDLESITEDFEIRTKKKIDEKKPFITENFFFISPFRSQSGEKAPWWLNPNITFVLVFLIVFLLFWIVFSIGGIHQGYVDANFDANFLIKKN